MGEKKNEITTLNLTHLRFILRTSGIKRELTSIALSRNLTWFVRLIYWAFVDADNSKGSYNYQAHIADPTKRLIRIVVLCLVLHYRKDDVMFHDH